MNIRQIPIINYHKIETEMDVGITTRHPLRFADDMRLLKNMGFQTVTFRQVLNDDETTKIKKPIIITFDDGYASVYSQAFPLMQEIGFYGVVYIPTAYIGAANDWDVQFGGKTYRHLNKNELRKLHDAGFEIGSHGIHHRAFTALSPAALSEELSVSKKQLEDLLSAPLMSLCYPFGQFNAKVIRQAREAGYHYGLASLYLRNHKHRHLALKRMNIYRFDSESMFKKKILAQPPTGLVLRDWFIQRGALATVLYQKTNVNFHI